MSKQSVSFPGDLSTDREQLLRDYAGGKVSWSVLRERGFENYLDVLGGLGALGLRPPVAGPDEGPNREARARARALVRQALLDTARGD